MTAGTAVKEMGMIFNGAMVRAILEGRKTQTRRPIKEMQDVHLPTFTICRVDEDGILRWSGIGHKGAVKLPFARIGDRLWVRETWGTIFLEDIWHKDKSTVHYRATEPAFFKQWNAYPSIHMPRWASRITLEITRVRVERLQEISEQDAKAEGVEDQDEFRVLWRSMYEGVNSWRQNPLVLVREFRVL